MNNEVDCILGPEEQPSPPKQSVPGLRQTGKELDPLQDSRQGFKTVKAPPHSAAIVPVLLYSVRGT